MSQSRTNGLANFHSFRKRNEIIMNNNNGFSCIHGRKKKKKLSDTDKKCKVN